MTDLAFRWSAFRPRMGPAGHCLARAPLRPETKMPSLKSPWFWAMFSQLGGKQLEGRVRVCLSASHPTESSHRTNMDSLIKYGGNVPHCSSGDASSFLPQSS